MRDSLRDLPERTSTGPRAERPLDDHVTHLQADLHLRRYSLWHYRVLPLAANKECYWARPGDTAPTLRHYYTGEPVPEDSRGEPLAYYLAAFSSIVPGGRLAALISFGDCGVNLERGLLTRDSLVWVPSGVTALGAPRPWLVGFGTGVTTVDSFRVEAEMSHGTLHPRAFRATARNDRNVLDDVTWAVSGLPVIMGGRVNDCVYELDDDLRHVFVLPPKNGLYIGEKAVKDARAGGWRPSEPLEVDLTLYGEVPSTIEALLHGGYREVFHTPAQPSEFQVIDVRRILCRFATAGYGLGVIGLCHDGSLGSYIAKAPPAIGGYFCPSVTDQIRMLRNSFAHAFVVEEGLDPTFYDPSGQLGPDAFPVRGAPGGRLSAVLCVYA